jgi:hypothetical protein
VEAADARHARRAAQEALRERSSESERWSLGVLRPLTPMAPGTSRYRITFALWESHEDRFVRRDVHELEVWATDAASARRIAQQEVQEVPGYEPVWRIRQVVRTDRPPRAARSGRRARRGAS